jgi:anti-sigma regulatory factor (Ser/Thr protein kinase)
MGTVVSASRPAGEPPAPRDGTTVDWRISVPGVPALVSVARRLVRSVLGDGPRCDDIELITSELVTNAIRHTPAGSVITLRVRASAVRVRVEVTDQGDPAWTEPRPADDDEEYGRGLAIVRLLADRTGHEPAPGGQVCWAEISRTT